MIPRPKILFVLTSHDTLPAKGIKTGFYLPELVHPYNALISDVDIVMASPKGGEAPVDPYSVEDTKNDAVCVDFWENKQDVWKKTEKLESFLGRASEFDGIFYVGGHGRELPLSMLMDGKIC